MPKSKLIKIKTKNFKGLGEFIFEPKSDNINIIYGDNGVGKSSFVKIFNFLAIVTEYIRLRTDFSRKLIGNPFFNVSPSLTNPYKEFSNISNDEDIELELIIKIDGENYKYGFSLNKENNITNEYFYLLKKTNLDEIKKTIFKKKLFEYFEIDEKYLIDFKVIKNEINKKSVNSIISILTFNILNRDDVQKMMDNPIISLIYSFTILNITNHETTFEDIYYRPITIIPNANIPVNKKDLIERFYKETEDFEDFVLSIDNKIKGINVVEKKTPDGQLNLSLSFKQYINNEKVIVPFELMSSGTKDYIKYFKIIQLLNEKEGLLKGTIGVFDEFGIHLHPTLAINILKYIHQLSIKNDYQIFFTSHQAILLDKKYTDLENKNKLIMIRNSRGDTKIKTLIGEGNRDNNYEKFIRGDYGGNDLNKII